MSLNFHRIIIQSCVSGDVLFFSWHIGQCQTRFPFRMGKKLQTTEKKVKHDCTVIHRRQRYFMSRIANVRCCQQGIRVDNRQLMIQSQFTCLKHEWGIIIEPGTWQGVGFDGGSQQAALMGGQLLPLVRTPALPRAPPASPRILNTTQHIHITCALTSAFNRGRHTTNANTIGGARAPALTVDQSFLVVLCHLTPPPPPSRQLMSSVLARHTFFNCIVSIVLCSKLTLQRLLRES